MAIIPIKHTFYNENQKIIINIVTLKKIVVI